MKKSFERGEGPNFLQGHFYNIVQSYSVPVHSPSVRTFFVNGGYDAGRRVWIGDVN